MSASLNLLNTIIGGGSGLVPIPYLLRSTGLVWGSVLLAVTAAWAAYTAWCVVRAWRLTGGGTYEAVTLRCLGGCAAATVRVTIIVFLFGVCVATFDIFADVASSALLVSTSFKHGLSYGRHGACRYGERVDERADDGLGGDDGAPHNWPQGACHTHSYFPELYLNERAAILRYQFDVPRSTSLFANAARMLPEEMCAVMMARRHEKQQGPQPSKRAFLRRDASSDTPSIVEAEEIVAAEEVESSALGASPSKPGCGATGRRAWWKFLRLHRQRLPDSKQQPRAGELSY